MVECVLTYGTRLLQLHVMPGINLDFGYCVLDGRMVVVMLRLVLQYRIIMVSDMGALLSYNVQVQGRGWLILLVDVVSRRQSL